MSTEIATISDKRLVHLDDRLYSDLPVADHGALELSPIDLFNKKNNHAVPLNSALNLAKLHDKKASLNVRVIGYELGQQEFTQKNPETKEDETIFRNVLYIFCEDGTVLFVHSLTAARPLFEIFRNFGIPSVVNGFEISIDLVSEKGRTRYMVQLLNIGPKA